MASDELRLLTKAHIIAQLVKLYPNQERGTLLSHVCDIERLGSASGPLFALRKPQKPFTYAWSPAPKPKQSICETQRSQEITVTPKGYLAGSHFSLKEFQRGAAPSDVLVHIGAEFQSYEIMIKSSSTLKYVWAYVWEFTKSAEEELSICHPRQRSEDDVGLAERRLWNFLREQ